MSQSLYLDDVFEIECRLERRNTKHARQIAYQQYMRDGSHRFSKSFGFYKSDPRYARQWYRDTCQIRGAIER
jgi:hypothetical protein